MTCPTLPYLHKCSLALVCCFYSPAPVPLRPRWDGKQLDCFKRDGCHPRELLVAYLPRQPQHLGLRNGMCNYHDSGRGRGRRGLAQISLHSLPWVAIIAWVASLIHFLSLLIY